MKNKRKINNNLSIEIKKYLNRTIVTLNKEGKKITLSDLKTNSHFTSNIVHDENYIVIYSKEYIDDKIVLDVESAYNIKSDTILDVKKNKKLSTELLYMYIRQYGFDIAIVLSIINQANLNIATEDEIEHITRYLTNGNKSISREEITKYILSTYSQLNKYTNLSESLSVLDYRKLLDEIELKVLYFHKMPQIIDSTIEKQKLDVLAIPNNKSFIVSLEKTEEFKKQNTDPNDIKRNNETKDRHSLKRVRKLNNR